MSELDLSIKSEAVECRDSIAVRLGSVDNKYIKSFSICLVPDQLRKRKVDAYRPQVVSIGPLHKGTNTDLLGMEEIKWRCMLHLLQRSKASEPDLMEVLLKCTDAMLRLDEIVRASYNVDEVRFKRIDLAKIMLVDGCFLLELLICGSPHIDAELPGPGPSPGAELITREKVLSDFTLFENQIPLGVLNCLSNVLFHEIKDRKVFQLDEIREVALSIMGYDCATLGSVDIGGFHFVELVHSFVHMEKDALEKDNENNDFKIDMERKVTFRIHPKKRLQPCAARLEAAGVKIQSTGADPGSTRFDLKVTFQHGKLTIPPLHITETTEAKWRNMIAWELNQSSITKKREIEQEGFSALFISYACFFRSLICCVDDVRLLQDKGVILVHQMETEKSNKNIMSDKELMYLFENMTRDVPGGEIDMDSWFAYVIQKLNSYRPPMPTIKYHATRTFKTIWHRFEWYRELYFHLIKVAFSRMGSFFLADWKLRQAATLLGIVLFILTLVQTIFSAPGH